MVAALVMLVGVSTSLFTLSMGAEVMGRALAVTNSFCILLEKISSGSLFLFGVAVFMVGVVTSLVRVFMAWVVVGVVGMGITCCGFALVGVE